MQVLAIYTESAEELKRANPATYREKYWSQRRHLNHHHYIYLLSSLLSQPLYTYRTVHTMPRSVEAVHRDQEVYYSQDCRDVILRKPKTFEMKLSRSYLISSDFNQQEFVLHKHSQVCPVNTCVAYFGELAYQDEVAIFSEQSCWKLSRV